MRFFANMKISNKVFLLISISLLSLTILGAISAYFVNENKKNLNSMYEDYFFSVSNSIDIRNNMRAMEAQLLRLIIEKDTIKREKIKKEVDERLEHVNRFIAYSIENQQKTEEKIGIEILTEGQKN